MGESGPSTYLFFKFYDPTIPKLSFITYGRFSENLKIYELCVFLNRKQNFSPDQLLYLYEEVKPDLVEPLNLNHTLKIAGLSNGDIICFQKQAVFTNCKFPTATAYYNYIENRVVVTFRDFEKPGEDKFRIELSRKMRYYEVAQKVGENIHFDMSYIRFHAHLFLANVPKKEAIEASILITLNDMLSDKEGSMSKELGLLYYRKVTTPVEELDRMEKKDKEKDKKEKPLRIAK